VPPTPPPARRRSSSREQRQESAPRNLRATSAERQNNGKSHSQSRARRSTGRVETSRNSGNKPMGVLAFLPFGRRSANSAPPQDPPRRVVPLRAASSASRSPARPDSLDPFTSTATAAAGIAASTADNAPSARPFPTLALFGSDGELLALSNERQELLCSVIGLVVKLGLVAVAGVSLFRLAGAYQLRMERQGEIAAVLELQNARMAKARERFDSLFMVEGEQRLIREQSQWIAPDRLRIVWQNEGKPFPTVETAAADDGKPGSRP